VGSLHLQRGQLGETAAAWQQYRLLADRMIAAEPREPKWQMEGAYADGNLGIVALEQRRFADAAILFARSLASVERLLAREPAKGEYRSHRAETLAFLADSLERSGRLDAARQWRERQLAELREQLRSDALDTGAQRSAMVAHQALSRLFYFLGEPGGAIVHADESTRLADRLRATEPGNAKWTDLASGALLVSGDIRFRLGRPDGAPAIEQGCRLAQALNDRNPGVTDWQQRLLRCQILRARLDLARGRGGDALLGVGQALAFARTIHSGNRINDRMQLARLTMLTGEIHRSMGDAAAAKREWQRALAQWPANVGETPDELDERAELLRSLGDRPAAARLQGQLRRAGYRPTDGP
jgi:tetratricopeptide (TPR) repeat protein